MKVIFVSSGNSKSGISPIILAQGESLKQNDSNIQLDYFPIKGKGFRWYFNSISKLRNHLKKNNYDIVHAHYSLSAIVASIARAKPLVVSLMGSDVKAKSWFRFFVFIFYKFFWNITIVKSVDMKKSLGFTKVEIIPNGVDIEKFKPIDKTQCQKELSWLENKIHILFAANPNRYEKNYPLAKEAINLLNNQNIELHFLNDIDNNKIPIYLNAADVILLTSLWEGSPNVIKEAMACNKSIVATDVGDIRWLFGNEKGYYLSTFDNNNIAYNINLALDVSTTNNETNGRQRIVELGLSSEIIAKRIIEIYKTII